MCAQNSNQEVAASGPSEPDERTTEALLVYDYMDAECRVLWALMQQESADKDQLLPADNATWGQSDIYLFGPSAHLLLGRRWKAEPGAVRTAATDRLGSLSPAMAKVLRGYDGGLIIARRGRPTPGVVACAAVRYPFASGWKLWFLRGDTRAESVIAPAGTCFLTDWDESVRLAIEAGRVALRDLATAERLPLPGPATV